MESTTALALAEWRADKNEWEKDAADAYHASDLYIAPGSSTNDIHETRMEAASERLVDQRDEWPGMRTPNALFLLLADASARAEILHGLDNIVDMEAENQDTAGLMASLGIDDGMAGRDILDRLLELGARTFLCEYGCASLSTIKPVNP